MFLVMSSFADLRNTAVDPDPLNVVTHVSIFGPKAGPDD